jgi:hypothetical protein
VDDFGRRVNRIKRLIFKLRFSGDLQPRRPPPPFGCASAIAGYLLTHNFQLLCTRSERHINDIQKFSSYLTENRAVSGSNYRFVSESHETHKCTVWAECSFLER